MSLSEDYVWLNGRLLPSSEATVPAGDFGLLYGEGLFETMRARDGRIAYLDRHLRRFIESAAWLELPLPDEAELRRGLSEILAATGGGDQRVRLTVTRGPAGRFDRPDDVPPTLQIITRPASLPPATMRACMALYRRDEMNYLHRFKTTSYLVNVLSSRYAKTRKYDEALFLNTWGELTEGSTTNLFLLRGDRLQTPPDDAGILPGVMRSVLLDEAYRADLQAEKTPLLLKDLFAAEAVYLTNAVIGIVPLVSLDGQKLGNPPPLPTETLPPHLMTTALQNLLWRPQDFQTP